MQFMFRQAVWSTQRMEGGLGWEQESSWRPEDSWVIHSAAPVVAEGGVETG